MLMFNEDCKLQVRAFGNWQIADKMTVSLSGENMSLILRVVLYNS
jgi:hypothetical protein